MNTLLKITLVALAAVISVPSFSLEPTQKFATCLVDSLNGKERKELAKWIFISMSVHPHLNEFSAVPNALRTETDQYIGALVTRMLTESCPAELQQANRVNPLALQKGFELVGQVAIQELLTNQETMAALSGYANYVDQSKITAILSKEKPAQ